MIKLIYIVPVVALLILLPVVMGEKDDSEVPDGALLPRRWMAVRYNESLKRCEDADMKPYMPKTREQWDNLAKVLAANNLRDSEIWIPATDRETEETLLWEDGTDVNLDNIKWYKDVKLKYNRWDLDCVAIGSGNQPNAVMLPCWVKCMPMVCVP
ncbi:unnamed protein product [Meganyctiphanes norvegica]|uniref:C-type lectin domain-containing protein n=1 Tax=Meganyctiphanes norvegica TaxID=48144 RepID=A0AAV2S9R3_MEGNR